MSIISVLNLLHRRRWYRGLSIISSVAYFLKGHGFVKSMFHEALRAYEYRVRDISYLSIGPGWAYTYDYLRKLLVNTFCFYYLPRSGDCVVDIGAGLGEETVIYANLVGNTGKVFSIEANPNTFNGLKYLCIRNNFRQVIPLNLAIYSTNGDVTIEDNHENYLKNTINTMSSNRISVQAKTFDTIVRENNISRIDFLKSNIEGAEQFLIQGMNESLPIIRNLCISCHDFRHDFNNEGEFYLTKSKVVNFLKMKGFTVRIRNTGVHFIDDYVYAQGN